MSATGAFVVFVLIFMAGFAFGMVTMIIHTMREYKLTPAHVKRLIEKEKWPRPPTTNMIYKKYKEAFPGLTKRLIRKAQM